MKFLESYIPDFATDRFPCRGLEFDSREQFSVSVTPHGHIATPDNSTSQSITERKQQHSMSIAQFTII